MAEETENPPIDIAALFDKAQSKSEVFSALVDKIDTAPDEQRALWREIYQNALDDRVNAQLLFTDLYRNVANNQHGHMNHGVLMTKYLERMNKSTDQLLKLSELVDKARQSDAEIDGEELYAEIDS